MKETMTPTSQAGAALPSDMPVALRAFVEQRADGYRAYAAALISSAAVRDAALALALGELTSAWDTSIATTASPAAVAWSIVKHRLMEHSDAHTPAAAAVQRVLAKRQGDDADIAVLAFHAQLGERAIADLTGLPLTAIQVRLYSTVQATAAGPTGLPREFETFTANWHDAFLGYTLTWCADPDHAREVLIDSTEACYRRWSALPAGSAAPAAAFRLLKDAITSHLGVCTHPVAEPDLHEALRALAKHDPLHADCLRLRHLVALDYPRTATVLGIGVNAARTATWSAFRFLEHHLTHDRSTPR